MDREIRHDKWEFKGRDLEGLTPLKVRDLIIKCFYTAHKATYTATKERLGTSSTDEDIYRSVITTVKMTFKEAGTDFENPTKQDLASVLVLLAKKAKLWGTPRDIMVHNVEQIQKLIDMLE